MPGNTECIPGKNKKPGNISRNSGNNDCRPGNTDRASSITGFKFGNTNSTPSNYCILGRIAEKISKLSGIKFGCCNNCYTPGGNESAPGNPDCPAGNPDCKPGNTAQTPNANVPIPSPNNIPVPSPNESLPGNNCCALCVPTGNIEYILNNSYFVYGKADASVDSIPITTNSNPEQNSIHCCSCYKTCYTDVAIDNELIGISVLPDNTKNGPKYVDAEVQYTPEDFFSGPGKANCQGPCNTNYMTSAMKQSPGITDLTSGGTEQKLCQTDCIPGLRIWSPESK